MAEKIFAPFNDRQVASLNEWQESNVAHPFTCGFAHSNGYIKLVASRNGWVCSDPECSYVQYWAHDYMTDSVLLSKLRELKPNVCSE